MKKLAKATLAITALALIIVAASATAQPPATPKPNNCPTGSYSTGIGKHGEHMCRLQPTGCPYGDTIPLEFCDKFATKQENTTDGVIELEENTGFVGK